MKYLIITPVALLILATASFAQSDSRTPVEKPNSQRPQAPSANAQSAKVQPVKAPDNALSGFNKFIYGHVKNILLRTAEKMPEENYSFSPAFPLRTFGQVVGHIADSQYTFCSAALGEKNPAPNIQKTKTSKADLIAALKDSLAYCDRAYDTMTDASASQMVKLFEADMPKVGVLNVNILHSVEHYGNLVIYLRLKNIVPPTSESGFEPQAKR